MSKNEMNKTQNSLPSISYSLLPLFILLIATFFRLYLLPALPPGLNFDEAGNGVAACDILRGQPKLWWEIGGGKEPLWPYLIALTTSLLGNIPIALRLPAAWTGILTVVSVYPLTLTLLRTKDEPHSRRAYGIAVLTMLGLALSAWHLHFSRLGFRAILFPLLAALGFYFFWRGIKCQVSGAKYQVLGALFVALAVYAYLAARLLIVIPLIFWMFYWLIAQFRSSTHLADFRRVSFWMAQFYGFLLFFLSPLIVYFVFNPADFVARSGAVSIFNPDWNQGDFWGTLWRTFTLTLGTFSGLAGDANPLVNLPGQPALPWFLAIFFVAGFLISLSRALAHPSYLFLLVWWIVMLLPALLAPEGAPHHLRLIGTLVPTYILVAAGVMAATQILSKILLSAMRNTQYASRLTYLLSAACYLLPAASYLLLSLNTYTHYFTRWPALDFTLPFDLYAVHLADQIAETPPGTTTILPMDIRAGAEARHYTVDYLLAHLDPPPYTYLPVDEQNAETILAQASQTGDALHVVRWTQDKHHQADAKEIVTYLLKTNAYLLKRESFPVYDVETYTLTGSPHFELPAIDQPVDVILDDVLRIDAVHLPPAASAGEWLPVALTLAPLAQMETDYKASLRLIDPAGQLVAQKDRVLLHTFHQGTSLWPPETVNEYYLLPVPTETPPGNYTATIVIYHPDTQSPLTAAGAAETFLGTVQVAP